MTAVRQQIVDTLWRGDDPFAGFPKRLYAVDAQGWGSSQHAYLAEAIAGESLVVVEIGVWKGVSTIAMAEAMRDRGVDGAVIAIDTWLGAADHWTHGTWFKHLAWDHGYPNLQRIFMANVVEAKLQDYVVPLPLDSLNAAAVLGHFGIQADVVHIDAGHEYASVIADLRAWWPLLKPGGLYIGDDYYGGGSWVGVEQAHDEFFAELGLEFEHTHGKCRIRKPA